MTELKLSPTTIANGGAAIARDDRGRAVFIPFALPGEEVRVTITTEKRGYDWARLEEVLQPSPDRVAPACRHFGTCGGCHFQHARYEAQLALKESIVRDQLQRLANFENPPLAPILPLSQPWAFQAELALSPTPEGGFGLWSPALRRVIPLEECPITHPDLVLLQQDIDLVLPELRKMVLRRSDDGAMLAALEVEGLEPPELEVDFPISVAIVLPDLTAASLIGDNYSLQTVKGRDFRVSPGCYFQSSPEGAALVVETVLQYAELDGTEQVLEGYSGVGTLTAFLAEKAAAITAVEVNPDAVADTAVNLAEFDNVSLYQDWLETGLPALEIAPDLVVVDPPADGLSRDALQGLVAREVPRLIYVSRDVATLARDGKHLRRGGYRLLSVQPIDTHPQTYHVTTVSHWVRSPA